jgi:hypothetical protein
MNMLCRTRAHCRNFVAILLCIYRHDLCMLYRLTPDNRQSERLKPVTPLRMLTLRLLFLKRIQHRRCKGGPFKKYSRCVFDVHSYSCDLTVTCYGRLPLRAVHGENLGCSERILSLMSENFILTGH